MGILNEDEIRKIIKRASVFQKYYDQSPSRTFTNDPETHEQLFEISDSLNLKREYVMEALIEHQGIPLDDPIQVETNSFHKIEVQAYANGPLEGNLVNELKAQLEYHFNTVGTVHRRKNKLFWNAKPAGPARLFATIRSPELEIEDKDGRLKFSLRQSLKTINKFFIPSIAGLFGSFMFLAAIIFDRAGNDQAPMLVASVIFFGISALLARFVKGRKDKRKAKLNDLMEVLQHTAERRFRSRSFKEKEPAPSITIPDLEDIEISDEELDEIQVTKKVKS